MYEIELTKEADKEIERLKKAGDMVVLKRISTLLHELILHPTMGTGKPEKLKYEYAGYWSRRINKKHRLIYQIDFEQRTVIVLSISGHYDDK